MNDRPNKDLEDMTDSEVLRRITKILKSINDNVFSLWITYNQQPIPFVPSPTIIPPNLPWYTTTGSIIDKTKGDINEQDSPTT